MEVVREAERQRRRRLLPAAQQVFVLVGRRRGPRLPRLLHERRRLVGQNRHLEQRVAQGRRHGELTLRPPLRRFRCRCRHRGRLRHEPLGELVRVHDGADEQPARPERRRDAVDRRRQALLRPAAVVQGEEGRTQVESRGDVAVVVAAAATRRHHVPEPRREAVSDLEPRGAELQALGTLGGRRHDVLRARVRGRDAVGRDVESPHVGDDGVRPGHLPHAVREEPLLEVAAAAAGQVEHRELRRAVLAAFRRLGEGVLREVLERLVDQPLLHEVVEVAERQLRLVVHLARDGAALGVEQLRVRGRTVVLRRDAVVRRRDVGRLHQSVSQ
mmetsp:Transcript_36817/g.113611  ORF Transcript_36817/g.113611 Transcript_36817/m.113611 type:complete len:329 (-) Transcript_36817:12-998(-)